MPYLLKKLSKSRFCDHTFGKLLVMSELGSHDWKKTILIVWAISTCMELHCMPYICMSRFKTPFTTLQNHFEDRAFIAPKFQQHLRMRLIRTTPISGEGTSKRRTRRKLNKVNYATWVTWHFGHKAAKNLCFVTALSFLSVPHIV